MFPILHLQGDPQQRGQQYGSQAAPLIRHSIASYARQFAHRCGLTWQQAQAQAEGSLPWLERHVPHLLEEIQGIAAGSGFRFAEILALNLRTEILSRSVVGGSHPNCAAALEHNLQNGVPQHPPDPAHEFKGIDLIDPAQANPDGGECTTLAALPQATSTHHTYLAQTWDWIGEQRRACVLLCVRSDNHPAYLTLTEAGILAKIGLNQAGLAVALNLLRSTLDGQTEGMPVHLLLRLLLECEEWQQAVERVGSYPYTASSCVSVAGITGQAVGLQPASAISFEISPRGIGLHLPQGGILAHTNHFLDPALREDGCPPPHRILHKARTGLSFASPECSNGNPRRGRSSKNPTRPDECPPLHLPLSGSPSARLGSHRKRGGCGDGSEPTNPACGPQHSRSRGVCTDFRDFLGLEDAVGSS